MEEIQFSDRFVLLERSDQVGSDTFDPLRVTLYAIVDTKDIPKGEQAPALAYCKTWADGMLTCRLLNFADATREGLKVQTIDLMKGLIGRDD